MDAVTFGILLQTLGPIVIPLLAGLTTQLGKWIFGAISPRAQAAVSPFLPIVSGVIGTIVATATGTSPVVGALGGLAATGAHQVVHQLNTASASAAHPSAPTP